MGRTGQTTPLQPVRIEAMMPCRLLRLMPAAFVLSTALAAGAAQAEPITIPHAQGETTLEAAPQTVMTSDWATFDNLSALGIPVAGVPTTNAPHYLADRIPADTARIGSLQEPDIEAIAAAAPDLMIIAARSRTAYPTLAPIVPTIDASVDNADIIGGLKHNLGTYAELFGAEARAAELIAALDARVAEAAAAAEGKGTGLVIVTNAGKIGIYGPESRVSWIYNTLGVPSVFDDVDDRDHGGDAISFEYLLETNPDWLFVIDRDAGVGSEGGAARALLDNELIHQTNFWKDDRIVYLDPTAAYISMNGYDAVMLLLQQVIDAYEGQKAS